MAAHPFEQIGMKKVRMRRVGSLSTLFPGWQESVWISIAANFAVIFPLLWLEWSVGQLLVLYWIEVAIIGAIGFYLHGGEKPPLAVVIFLCIYGYFMFLALLWIVGTFVLILEGKVVHVPRSLGDFKLEDFGGPIIFVNAGLILVDHVIAKKDALMAGTDRSYDPNSHEMPDFIKEIFILLGLMFVLAIGFALLAEYTGIDSRQGQAQPRGMQVLAMLIVVAVKFAVGRWVRNKGSKKF